MRLSTQAWSSGRATNADKPVLTYCTGRVIPFTASKLKGAQHFCLMQGYACCWLWELLGADVSQHWSRRRPTLILTLLMGVLLQPWKPMTPCSTCRTALVLSNGSRTPPTKVTSSAWDSAFTEQVCSCIDDSGDCGYIASSLPAACKQTFPLAACMLLTASGHNIRHMTY